ncbi:MAG: hypothetical protein PHC94_06280 [Methylobacter sp.]|nr:hypothetical protein [Methylobacter sp.]
MMLVSPSSLRVLTLMNRGFNTILAAQFFHHWPAILIPMNALLQHRGHQLMGSGHSIAVQNFNENLSILMMLGAYALMIKVGLAVNTIVIVFGLFVSSAMAWLTKKHGHDQD